MRLNSAGLASLIPVTIRIAARQDRGTMFKYLARNITQNNSSRP